MYEDIINGATEEAKGVITACERLAQRLSEAHDVRPGYGLQERIDAVDEGKQAFGYLAEDLQALLTPHGGEA